MFFNKDCATYKPRLCGIGGSYNINKRQILSLNPLSRTTAASINIDIAIVINPYDTQ